MHQHSKAIACVWCSCSRPPEICVVLSSKKMLEENLLVIREVPATSSCNPNALIESILDIMSLHIPMRHVLCRWVESCCVTSLGLPVSGCPRTDISDKET